MLLRYPSSNQNLSILDFEMIFNLISKIVKAMTPCGYEDNQSILNEINRCNAVDGKAHTLLFSKPPLNLNTTILNEMYISINGDSESMIEFKKMEQQEPDCECRSYSMYTFARLCALRPEFETVEHGMNSFFRRTELPLKLQNKLSIN
jgi:hypothetical protein